MSATATGFGFATWVSEVPTGGNVYDVSLAAALRATGAGPRPYRVTGPWPAASAADRWALADLLRAERTWLVDALVACAAPEVVEAVVANGQRLVVLLHSFLPDETWLTAAERRRYADGEGRALRAASSVVCTSRWAAEAVRSRYGRDQVGVAIPGVDPAPLAGGSVGAGPPRLLALGSLIARKDQLTLVRALRHLGDLDWSAHLVGADHVEPAFTARVRAEIEQTGLAARLRIRGARTGPELESEWSATDLLVLCSRAETYGMVVTEALSRGIPSVVSAGTGAVEAQAAGRPGQDNGDGDGDGGSSRAGTQVAPGDPRALAGALRHWLTDAGCRADWSAAACRQRDRLPTWSDAASAVLGVVGPAV